MVVIMYNLYELLVIFFIIGVQSAILLTTGYVIYKGLELFAKITWKLHKKGIIK